MQLHCSVLSHEWAFAQSANRLFIRKGRVAKSSESHLRDSLIVAKVGYRKHTDAERTSSPIMLTINQHWNLHDNCL